MGSKLPDPHPFKPSVKLSVELSSGPAGHRHGRLSVTEASAVPFQGFTVLSCGLGDTDLGGTMILGVSLASRGIFLTQLDADCQK